MSYTWTRTEDLAPDAIRLRYKRVLRGLVVDQVLEYYGVSSVIDLTLEQIHEIESYRDSLEEDHALRLGFYELFMEWSAYNE